MSAVSNHSMEQPLTPEQKEAQQLSRVAEALLRVPAETNQMIFEMAQQSSEDEIAQMFNQDARDLFDVLARITKRLGCEAEYNINGYSMLFESAIPWKKSAPVDKFSLLILEFAPEIYSEDEDCFLTMNIPDKEVSVENSFGLIRSDMFKQLWKAIGTTERARLKDKIIGLTVHAHTYFYRTALIQK